MGDGNRWIMSEHALAGAGTEKNDVIICVFFFFPSGHTENLSFLGVGVALL